MGAVFSPAQVVYILTRKTARLRVAARWRDDGLEINRG
jgi:hypothetical protein